MKVRNLKKVGTRIETRNIFSECLNLGLAAMSPHLAGYYPNILRCLFQFSSKHVDLLPWWLSSTPPSKSHRNIRSHQITILNIQCIPQADK
jgi:hypothetical protein